MGNQGRIAFLSAESVDQAWVNDHLAAAPLADRGWALETLPWQASTDWSRFAGVVVRSTWDYQHDAARFLDTLAGIARVTRLANPLEQMRANVDKRYLLDLGARGIPIVPTLVLEGLAASDVEGLFDRLACDELVIKPSVGASGGDTYRLHRSDTVDDGMVRRLAEHAGLLIQPFLPAVVEEGEWSLFYFGGALSHTTCKRPKQGEFRVQEEHGGQSLPTAPPPGLDGASRTVLATLDEMPLYARVDWLRGLDGSFQLMELELIEPSLYLDKDPDAPERFAAAIDRWLTHGL